MIRCTKSREVSCIVVDGADHTMNRKTRIDDDYNHEQEFWVVKEDILTHFQDYM